MPRLWLVTANSYRRGAMHKGFIASLLSVPIIVALTLGLVYFMAELREDRRPVGYVDNAAVLVKALPPTYDSGGEHIAMIPFKSTESAQQALTADDIQAYYVLPADYRQTGQVEVFYKKTSGGASAAQFHDFVRANLLSSQPPEIAQRIVLGPDLVVRRPDGSREFSDSTTLGDVMAIFVIIFMALAFMMLIALNPGQPMLAVAEEKENRTMEIVVTSMSPGAFIAGKVIGTVAIAGTLVAGWVALIAVAAIVAVRIVSVSWLQDVRLSPGQILFPLALYIPLYVVICALQTAMGATVVEAREGQQMSFLFIVPLMLPFYALGAIMDSPNSPLAVVLSLFPLTAPTVLPLRLYLQPVPAWQTGLSIALLILSAVGAIWLAGRAYRLGMVRYGQRLGWREILGTVGRQRRSGGQP